MTDAMSSGRSLAPSLVLFSYFQLLDLLTTVIFLMRGVREGNPLVRYVIDAAPNPLTGLVIVKIAALAIGIYCWRLGRRQLLARINVLFGALISWNLLALIVASV